MMLHLLSLIFFLSFGRWVNGQSDPLLVVPDAPVTDIQKPARTYFLGGRDLVGSGAELVVLVSNPQTQMVREMGSVLVRDTSFLRFVQDSIYKNLDGRREVVHFCGHDMYFYAKYGSNLQFIRAVNSNCGLNDFGCENLERLMHHAERLELDSTSTFAARMMKRQGTLKSILCLNMGEADWSHNSFFLNTMRVPSSYDLRFERTVELDNCSPVLEQLKRSAFQHIPDVDHRAIAVRLVDENKVWHKEQQYYVMRNGQYNIEIYLDEACADYFPDQKMETVEMPPKAVLKEEVFILVREKDHKTNK